MHGIQLKFANGNETPLYQGYSTREESEIKRVELDFPQGPRVAGIYARLNRNRLSGLRFVDEDGNIIVEHLLKEKHPGDWSKTGWVSDG